MCSRTLCGLVIPIVMVIVHPPLAHSQRVLDVAWEVGGLDDPTELYWEQIVDVVVVDQYIFVVDAGAPAVRRFSLEGEYAGDLGRPGQGPGEYLRPISISNTADTVIVQDLAQRRRAFFTTDRVHVRTSRAGQPETIPLRWLRDMRFGWTVGQTSWSNRGGEEFPYHVVVWDDPQDVDTVAAFAANQLRFKTHGDPQWHSSALSAGADGAVAVLGDSAVAVVNGVESTLDLYAVRDGGLTRVRTETLDGAQRPMTDAGQGRLEDRFMTWSQSDPRLESLRFPELVTAWAGAKPDPGGDVWLLRGGEYLDQVAGGQRWAHWAWSEGITEELEMPLGTEVLWFGRDYIIAKSTGELGVETLQLFHLSPA